MNKYIFIEPLSTMESTHFLNIGNGNFPLLNVLRLITGTSCIKDNSTSKEIRLKDNFTYIPITKVNHLSLKKILGNFSDIELISQTELSNSFTRARGTNRTFYALIKKELLEAIIAYKKNDYIKSFLFLYRLIEAISFTTPLIFLSKNSDYFKTYNELKELFSSNDSNVGELGFFKKFLRTILKDEDYWSIGATLDFNCITNNIERDSCITIYKKYMTKNKSDQSINGLKSETSEEIILEVINFHELFMSLRNRFFHNLKGTIRDNIQANELFDSNLFFKPIVTQGLNHISLIIFKLIEKDLDF